MSKEQDTQQYGEHHQSKSELKREVQEITKLGQRLLKLPANALKQFPLSEWCLKALLEGQKIKSPVGLKRQIKYIGKLLRDEDHAAIQQKLLLIDQEKSLANKQFHQLEQWRDRLIREGDKAVFELLQQQPEMDRQHLRQLVRNAQHEINNNKPPKAQRLIFQYLKEYLHE